MRSPEVAEMRRSLLVVATNDWTSVDCPFCDWESRPHHYCDYALVDLREHLMWEYHDIPREEIRSVLRRLPSLRPGIS